MMQPRHAHESHDPQQADAAEVRARDAAGRVDRRALAQIGHAGGYEAQVRAMSPLGLGPAPLDGHGIAGQPNGGKHGKQTSGKAKPSRTLREQLLNQPTTDAEIEKNYGTQVVDSKTMLARLGHTSDQRRVLAEAVKNVEFAELFDWFEKLPDGNPLRYLVKPGYKTQGQERFGGFSRDDMAIIINPAKAEHTTNPQELVETLVHEMIHAALYIHGKAVEKGLKVPRLPFSKDINDLLWDEEVTKLGGPKKYIKRATKSSYKQGSAAERYVRGEYGDSDSSPKTRYNDINSHGQALIMRIVADNLKRTGIGKETLSFVNARARAQLRTKGRKAP